jgi:hypothetical protein
MTEMHLVTTYNSSHAKKLKIKDDLIKDFPAEAAMMINDIKSYWHRNVNKYFMKSENYPNAFHAHQLQNACVIETVAGTGTSQSIMTVDLDELISPGGFEYGEVIIKGRQDSENFIYVPHLGASIDIDKISYDMDVSKRGSIANRRTTRGTTPEAWRAWKADFNAYVRQRSIQFVRQCIKKGLIRRDK